MANSWATVDLVALYAVTPLRGVEHLVLDDLAVPTRTTGAGSSRPTARSPTAGRSTRTPDVRAGWQRVRAAATGRLVHGVVVPSFVDSDGRAARI
ncbi:hypothetical protein AB0E82_15300 [Streptomyces anulatus]|uniref:hypothetical protein n=1 Tax=Streptomyces anulatus TaxID=1892 RepID=UPI00340C11F8